MHTTREIKLWYTVIRCMLARTRTNRRFFFKAEEFLLRNKCYAMSIQSGSPSPFSFTSVKISFNLVPDSESHLQLEGIRCVSEGHFPIFSSEKNPTVCSNSFPHMNCIKMSENNLKNYLKCTFLVQTKT